MTKIHRPLGPGGTWKQGQRVPATGWWKNQLGQVAMLDAKSTFPPPFGKNPNRIVTYWTLIRAAATAN